MSGAVSNARWETWTAPSSRRCTASPAQSWGSALWKPVCHLGSRPWTPSRAKLAFEEAWAGWVDWALEAPELRPDLELAFSLGLTPGHLREVALAFHQNYDMLPEVSFADVSLPPVAAISELVDGASELARLCQYSRIE